MKTLLFAVFALAMAPALANPPSDVFGQWLAAETLDAQAAAQRLDVLPLSAYQALLAADQQALETHLAPLFSPGADGWVDCAQAQIGLAHALEKVSSPLGVEQAVLAGEKVVAVQCPTAIAWRTRLPVALARVSTSLPKHYSATRAALDQSSVERVLVDAQAKALPVADPGCWRKRMASARSQSLTFEQGVRATSRQCASGGH